MVHITCNEIAEMSSLYMKNIANSSDVAINYCNKARYTQEVNMELKKGLLWFGCGALAVMGVFAAILLLNLGASNPSFPVEETEHVYLYTGDASDKVDNETEYDVSDVFSINSASLSAGEYVSSQNIYLLGSEEDCLIYSMNWAPTGQSVRIGFMSVENDSIYLNNAVEGGSASGTISTDGVPDGEYYVVVFAASDNTEPFSINASCEWKNEQ